MKSPLKNKLFLSFILFYTLSVFMGITPNLNAAGNKNVILVLDTSMSMIGYGGKNILEDVKRSISKYIEKLSDGDKVTFVTFSTDVKAYPTVLIDDENDRDILKKYISVTEAKGKWTYTIRMLKKVLSIAEDLNKSDKDRQTIIVVMTDAIDDPPPGKRKDRFDIKSIASEYSGKDWWIYLISFAKNKEAINKIKSALGVVSKKVDVIDKSDFQEKGTEVIPVDKTYERGIPVYIIIIIAAIVILMFIIIIVRKGGGFLVTGRLEYWNVDVLDPYIEKFDLTRQMSRDVTIGKNVRCHLNIHDLEIAGSFSIIADKKQRVLLIKGEDGVEIEFKNKESGNILKDSDVFQVGNYGFKYFAD